MHREDNSNYLLYIEPKNKSTEPVDDEWTKLVRLAFSKSITGGANYSNLDDMKGIFSEGKAWKGHHWCSDGTISENKDYLLQNGMITNSLCVHYMKWFRNEIPASEWIKLQKLKEFYDVR